MSEEDPPFSPPEDESPEIEGSKLLGEIVKTLEANNPSLLSPSLRISQQLQNPKPCRSGLRIPLEGVSFAEHPLKDSESARTPAVETKPDKTPSSGGSNTPGKNTVKPFTKESLERLECRAVQLVREYGFQPRRKLSIDDGARLPRKFEPFPKKYYGRPLEEIDNFIYDEVSCWITCSGVTVVEAGGYAGPCHANPYSLIMMSAAIPVVVYADFLVWPRQMSWNCRSLIMRNMSLSTIGPNAFEMLPQLQFLDISTNNLSKLGSASFVGLKNLITLNISNNHIIMNPISPVFSKLTTLLELKLSHNFMTAIESEAFNLKNLEILFIDHNYLSIILKDGFKGLNRLKYLDLSYNHLSYFEKTTFSVIPNLEKIDLSHNRIVGQFDQTTMNSLIHIKVMDMSFNGIRKLTLDGTQGMWHIRSVNLENNKIEGTIFKYSFLGLVDDKNIESKSIILSNNSIKILKNEAFFVGRVDTINLTKNAIREIEKNAFAHFHIARLDLSFNKLREIDFNKTDMRLSLIELYAQSNHIVNINYVTFDGLTKLKILDMFDNNISRLDPQSFKDLTSLESLDISGNNIKEIPMGLFYHTINLKVLNFSRNHLQQIMYGNLGKLTQLRIMDLSYNQLQDVEEEVFFNLNKLRLLVIDGNKFRTVELKKMKDYMADLTFVSIGQNNMKCKWLTKTLAAVARENSQIHISSIQVTTDSENVDGISCIA